MVTMVTVAPAAPNGDNGNHQGYCSRCGKIWTLNERQGVCQWCRKPASCQTTKAKAEDTQDLLHDIILTPARAERNNGHKPFTEAVMYRIASYAQAHYWYSHYKLTMGLDCGHCSSKQRRKCKEGWLYGECPKAVKIESLNKPVIDSEGNTTELGELTADDRAIDLDAWVSSSTWEIGYPKRLVEITYKLKAREALTKGEHCYLQRFRKREQKKLFLGEQF